VDKGDGVESAKDLMLLLVNDVRMSVNVEILTMYIFQLMDHRRGGTANARMQFQVQLAAVASETAFARTLAGKISEG
jgi:hypothetical protein